MVKCVLRLLLDDRTLCIQSENLENTLSVMQSGIEIAGSVSYLECTGEGIQQDCEEEQGASTVETPRVMRQVVKNASDYQSHDEVTDGA